MKIAIDFDDVVVDTMKAFLNEWNKGRTIWSPRYLHRKNITNWNLPSLLGVPVETVKMIYDERINYSRVEFIDGAVEAILKLRDTGHQVVILSANDRYRDIRDALNRGGLQNVPLKAGEKHKAGYCRDKGIDVLVEDRPSYLKGAVTVGVHAIRFIQPWNNMGEAWGSSADVNPGLKHNARNWGDVTRIIYDMSLGKTLATLEMVKGPRLFGKQVPPLKSVDIDGPKIGDVVANEYGAKQTKIAGDYTLLPPLALKEVAIVLEEGAAKYGVGNWEKLSIDEVLNHVYAHLIEYGQKANTEDLSHAACRILMALQLQIEQEDK